MENHSILFSMEFIHSISDLVIQRFETRHPVDHFVARWEKPFPGHRVSGRRIDLHCPRLHLPRHSSQIRKDVRKFQAAVLLILPAASQVNGTNIACFQSTAQILPSASQLHKYYLLPVNCTNIACCQSTAQILPSASQLHKYYLLPVNCTNIACCQSTAQILPAASQLHRYCLLSVNCTNIACCQSTGWPLHMLLSKFISMPYKCLIQFKLVGNCIWHRNWIACVVLYALVI